MTQAVPGINDSIKLIHRSSKNLSTLIRLAIQLRVAYKSGCNKENHLGYPPPPPPRYGRVLIVKIHNTSRSYLVTPG